MKNLLASVDNSVYQDLRPAPTIYSRDSGILNEEQTLCVQSDRTGSRGQAPGRRKWNYQQPLIALLLSVSNVVVFADGLGMKTYQSACQNCHAPQFAKGIKAPAAFNKKEWDIRFKNAAKEAKKNPAQYKSDMDYLLHSLTIGKGLMQHGGLCNESEVANKDCSSKALIDAINYMSQR